MIRVVFALRYVAVCGRVRPRVAPRVALRGSLSLTVPRAAVMPAAVTLDRHVMSRWDFHQGGQGVAATRAVSGRIT